MKNTIHKVSTTNIDKRVLEHAWRVNDLPLWPGAFQNSKYSGILIRLWSINKSTKNWIEFSHQTMQNFWIISMSIWSFTGLSWACLDPSSYWCIQSFSFSICIVIAGWFNALTHATGSSGALLHKSIIRAIHCEGYMIKDWSGGIA